MEIKSLEISGIASMLMALRLPFGLETRSNIRVHGETSDDNSYIQTSGININEDDMKLIQGLIKNGDEHAKVVRGVIAYLDIIAPVYWWCEAETYRAGHERLASSSTMHIDCKGLTGEKLQKAKSDISMGKELRKIDMFSYQTLRRIYHQRKDHRLPEWHQFIDFIHTLPFAEELIFVK